MCSDSGFASVTIDRQKKPRRPGDADEEEGGEEE